MLHSHRLELFACRASEDFARKVIATLNRIKAEDEPEIHLGGLDVTQFSDGEFQPMFSESVRGATVYIIQSTTPPADNLMELLLTIDAAKRASADEVVAVMPYFGWARQDRKDRPRVAIGAKLVANLLRAAGADRVMACDLHAEQIQGFFDIPLDHIYASKVFIPYIKGLGIDNLAIAAPDMGGAKRANAYARELDASVIICHKTRERANVVGSITAIGEVEQNPQFRALGGVHHRHGAPSRTCGRPQDQDSHHDRSVRKHHPQGIQLRIHKQRLRLLT